MKLMHTMKDRSDFPPLTLNHRPAPRLAALAAQSRISMIARQEAEAPTPRFNAGRFRNHYHSPTRVIQANTDALEPSIVQVRVEETNQKCLRRLSRPERISSNAGNSK